MPPTAKTSRFAFFFRILVFLLTARAAVHGQFSQPEVQASKPPGFVIAEQGFRHSLAPVYSTISDWIDPSSALGRTYQCVLQSGPQGMTLTAGGVMEWIPGMASVGNTAVVAVTLRVMKNGALIRESSKSYHIAVLAGLPELAEIDPRVTYERNPIGWNVMIFDGFQPDDDDRRRFRWSLVDPPPGVYIDTLGGLHWPDDCGYSRPEPYTFTVRIDYETASGWLFDEVIYRQRVLPQPATNNYGELRSYNLPPEANGMLGYSVSAGDGWVAAGEPFPDSSIPGRMRLWKLNPGNGTYYDHLTFQSELVIGGDSFGASVSLAPADTQHPLRIAVGAPAASRLGNGGGNITTVGAAHVYTCEPDGTWSKEATLNPPVIRQALEFGAGVSIQGNTLAAGMPGMNGDGHNTGATAVFRHDSAGWSLSQTLEAEDPAWGDRFGEQVAMEGEWIAAAAPGDDDEGNNAGAVHLYQKVAAGYVHRQIIHAPGPEIGTRFGERMLMTGSWLFASSFRERENTGAVHVFRQAGGVWSFHQSLVSPFAVEGSAFGVSLSHSQGVLAVSAPGHLFGSPEIDGSDYPWKGITLFKLAGESWEWSRQVTESPDSGPDLHTWGFSIAQVSPDLTVAGIPDHSPWVDGQEKALAGRLFLHRWPARLADPFPGVLAGLPPVEGRPAGPDDDSNQNGVPNLLDWMMGSNPGAAPDSWTSRVPQSKQPFIRRNIATGETEFMIPQLHDGMNRRPVVEISEDLSTWTPVGNARWGPLEDVYFRGSDGSNYLTHFHPVLIPAGNAGSPTQRFFRWAVP